MLRTGKYEIANLRANYATAADFCKAFENEMKSLYLLAFLLLTNHKDAEQCFVTTVEAAFNNEAVFKEWAPSWVKRSLVKNAIRIASPTSDRHTKKRDLWRAQRYRISRYAEIDAVTRLAPLERFVFVMSVLERYSAWECSILLGCDLKKVGQVRTRALRELTGPDGIPPRAETMFSHSFPASGTSINARDAKGEGLQTAAAS